MTTYLPPEVQEGLDAARRRAERRSHRLRVEVEGTPYRILRAWPGGFAVEAEHAPHLRGLVDLFEGARHLSQCLIVAASEEAGEMQYEFKRLTAVASAAARDFVADAEPPAGLIEDAGRIV